MMCFTISQLELLYVHSYPFPQLPPDYYYSVTDIVANFNRFQRVRSDNIKAIIRK